jgi:hypothetical protein
MVDHARPAGRHQPVRHAVEVRKPAAAPRVAGPGPGRRRLGVVCAAAGPVRHHHAVRPAFRAPSPGLARCRSVAASPDGQWFDDTLLKKPKVYTMDELMRLPSVSRIHFIECGANTGLEWGNVAVPTVQYTHGMLSCSEFTGVPLKPAAGRLRRRLQEGPLRAGRGRRRLVDDAHDPDGNGRVRRGLRRLRPERRNAAPGKRLPAAPGRAGRAGRELGQVAAPHRSRRQAWATKDEACITST